ncbi:linear amide C-N hydrolase [Leucobacter chromiireducens]|uniref:Linear amide C-N hydrolase n=1 Tax=Leucobacter chromiireducens subsp. chromiireducens TaxID=660067 RepID=A0ABS1SNQ3_9MICO|nr:linear amide C-N hydrolase [Leucobacter chromiireducens]MBL3689530.1 linear amide C-N hydrolase [Leucobacter chromiireducens subsp. chromiireducens]
MCTRFLWSSLGTPGSGNVLVGRSMDWFEDTRTVLAVRPRGVERESAPGDPGSFSWRSEYGSVVCLMYGAIAVDGLNEVGLQVSGLYLAESDYGERDAARPGLALAQAIQCLLDRFATTAAAVAWLQESNVQIIPLDIGGKPGTGHIALGDPSGDSAIIEFIAGEMVVHHGTEFTVMANSPVYSEQLELEQRYAGLGGELPLPGGTDSPDRFARAAFYSARLPETESARAAAAYAFSVIRNASAPFGTADPVRPNVSTTRWRTVADLSDRRFFYESTSNPNVVWVELTQLDFTAEAELRFDPEASTSFSGKVNEAFQGA